MASGYVTEVLNGNVTTLEQFAGVCAKGFGATSHQQDENLNTPLKEAVVSKYHKKAIRELKANLKKFNDLSDEQLIADELKALETSKAHYLEKIVLVKKAKRKCAALLLDAQLWEPPTENHIVVKEMMEEHLKATIEFDCDLEPIKNLIEDIDNRVLNIDVEAMRKKQVEAIEKQIEFHDETYKVEKDHVEQSNKWVSDLMSSFK